MAVAGRRSSSTAANPQPASNQQPVPPEGKTAQAPVLQHVGQGHRLDLGAAHGTDGGFLLITQARVRDPDQLGVTTPEGGRNLEQLPCRNLGHRAGGAGIVEPGRCRRQRRLAHQERHRPRQGGREISQAGLDPVLTGHALHHPSGRLQQGGEATGPEPMDRQQQPALLQARLLPQDVESRQMNPSAPGSEGGREGPIIGSAVTTRLAVLDVEQHPGGTPFEHQGRQPGLQGPRPGPGAHLPPEGGGLAFLRSEQLPQLQGVVIDAQDHRIGRWGTRTAQQEEGPQELVVEQPRTLAQGRGGHPVESCQQVGHQSRDRSPDQESIRG
jgi:hypothetical protein